MSACLAIAAGGTGGHLVPAFAVADAVRERSPQTRIVFIGGRRGLEAEMVPAAGYPLHTTVVRPFGRDLRGMAAAMWLLPATLQARRILKREAVSMVLGMGGYPSLPAVLASRMRRIPVLIHEQNATPGLANELGARFTPHVAVSFPQTARAFGRVTPRLVGVPVRRAIATLDRASRREEAAHTFRLRPDRATVLVFGGSLGAARINEATVALADRWNGRDDVQLLIATGRAHHDRIVSALSASTVALHIAPFIERMDLAYALADLVVSRAGASTVYEIAAAGVPSVLVPYPHARRREQHANAALLADAGAAHVLEDDETLPERLPEVVGDLIADASTRARMAAAALAVARPDAADVLAGWLLELAGVRT